jgi:hypothetical protein
MSCWIRSLFVFISFSSLEGACPNVARPRREN